MGGGGVKYQCGKMARLKVKIPVLVRFDGIDTDSLTSGLREAISQT